jgi:hypothetical protein
MTITLDDVDLLLNIPITGRTVSMETFEHENDVDMLARALDVSMREAEAEICSGSVRLEWLRNRFGNFNKQLANYPSSECVARAYLLYMLGCTLFVDKSSVRVPVSFLRLLENLEEVNMYSWGAACLAHLYRQLGCASRYATTQIAGYTTLIEVFKK